MTNETIGGQDNPILLLSIQLIFRILISSIHISRLVPLVSVLLLQIFGDIIGCLDETFTNTFVIKVVVEVLLGAFDTVQLFHTEVVLGNGIKLECFLKQFICICFQNRQLFFVDSLFIFQFLSLFEGVGEAVFVGSLTELNPSLIHLINS